MRRKDDIETSRGRSDRRGVGVRWWHDAAAKRLRWVGPDGASHTLLDDRDGGGGGGGGGDVVGDTASTAGNVVTMSSSDGKHVQDSGVPVVRVPSSGEKDALAGSASTPGSANRYLTEADASVSPGAGRVPRADGLGVLDAWVSTATALVYGLVRLGVAGGALAYDASTSLGRTLLAAADAATARSALDVTACNTGARWDQVGTDSYFPAHNVTGTGAFSSLSAVTAGRYYASKWTPTRSGTIDQLAIYVATTAIGSTCAIGLCADSGDKPGTVLASAQITTASSGKRTGSVSVSVSADTTYWIVVVCSAAPTFAGILTTARAPLRGYKLDAISTVVGEYVAGLYGWPLSLPTWTGATGITTGGNAVPSVFFRWSA